MAAARLGCHWQTLLYREKRGQLNPIKIGRRKFYSAGQVDLLKKNNPVHNKPHWTKMPIVKTKTKQTLWNRIKTAIASFVK
jgi:hypothetical protein